MIETVEDVYPFYRASFVVVEMPSDQNIPIRLGLFLDRIFDNQYSILEPSRIRQIGWPCCCAFFGVVVVKSVYLPRRYDSKNPALRRILVP